MTIDQVRNYWDSRPCNVRHSSVDIDENPAQYSSEVTRRKWIVEPHIHDFAMFGSWYGKKVLELGCGIGTDTLMFAAFTPNVFAVDISEKSVEILEKRARAAGVDSRIQIAVANIEESLFPIDSLHWNSFDLVYSFGVIHHTPHPAMAVRNARLYLKPGGTFKLMLYNRKSWRVLAILGKNWRRIYYSLIAGVYRGLVDEIVARDSEAQSGCPITHTFTKKKARDLLESQGFIIQEMTVEHIFPYKVKDYIEGRYVKAFPWKLMPRRLFQWLEHKIGWHLCITAIKPEVE